MRNMSHDYLLPLTHHNASIETFVGGDSDVGIGIVTKRQKRFHRKTQQFGKFARTPVKSEVDGGKGFFFISTKAKFPHITTVKIIHEQHLPPRLKILTTVTPFLAMNNS